MKGPPIAEPNFIQTEERAPSHELPSDEANNLAHYWTVRALVHRCEIFLLMSVQGQNEKSPFWALCQLRPAADITAKSLAPVCANWRPEQVQQLDYVVGEHELRSGNSKRGR